MIFFLIPTSVSHSVVSDSDPMNDSHQAPLSMGFSGKNTAVGYHSILQGIFPTQGSDLGPESGSPALQQIFYHPNHQGSPGTQ